MVLAVSAFCFVSHIAISPQLKRSVMSNKHNVAMDPAIHLLIKQHVWGGDDTLINVAPLPVHNQLKTDCQADAKQKKAKKKSSSFGSKTSNAHKEKRGGLKLKRLPSKVPSTMTSQKLIARSCLPMGF